jgi:hypothetical protein
MDIAAPCLPRCSERRSWNLLGNAARTFLVRPDLVTQARNLNRPPLPRAQLRCPLNLLWEYSIEYYQYGNTQLSGPTREAGVAELSGPASAASLSGSGTIRGHRSLGRQRPSAPPALSKVTIFDLPRKCRKCAGRKEANRKLNNPQETWG